MGLFDGMFGSKLESLDETSDSARAISGAAAFAEFVGKANDRIEVVAGDGALYAFVGKPPKAFGLVWFTDEGRLDVRSAMERGLMSREGAARLVGELGPLYEASSAAPRYEYRLDGHKVIVADSADLHSAIARAVEDAMQ